MSHAWSGGRQGFSAATRSAILARDHQCQLALDGCTTIATEADHITPLAWGGDNTLANGRGLCAHCHGLTTQAQAAEGRRRTIAKGRYPGRPNPGITQRNECQ